jgi:hypothetical protein
MFSSNLKRSVATLGVVAGLLAAAVPASAAGTHSDDAPVDVEGKPTIGRPVAVDTAEDFVLGFPYAVLDNNAGPDDVSRSASVLTDYDRNGFSSRAPRSEGIVADAAAAEAKRTQVGSEGMQGNNDAAGREPLSFDCAELVESACAPGDGSGKDVTRDNVANTFFGGVGNDTLDSGAGDILADGGTGDDKIWNPGGDTDP